jgi:hypothetical protein
MGDRTATVSALALSGWPSNESAVRCPVPLMTTAISRPRDHPAELTTSWMTERRLGDFWATVASTDICADCTSHRGTLGQAALALVKFHSWKVVAVTATGEVVGSCPRQYGIESEHRTALKVRSVCSD